MAVDPLAEIVTLLQPAARFSKLVECKNAWRIRRGAMGEPFYSAILKGSCRVKFGHGEPIVLHAGDFVLAPAAHDLVNESVEAPSRPIETVPVQVAEGHFRVGPEEGAADLVMRIGHCSFGAPDANLLVSLLPDVVVVRGERRLTTLMELIGEETRGRRPARDLVLERLLEVLLIEALRSGTDHTAAPGLSRGLADERLSCALRAFHGRPAHPWTVADLAAAASLSRSAFFSRFSRIVGVPPMEYLLAWRMALAKQLLRMGGIGVDQVAERVGYGSASAFSVAFARYARVPPARYARTHRAD
ncbi:AraC family transcriptional regulator [Rhizobium sp. S96]|uniref:AraC family transcriptional regulator n=1 Tax=Rhizobium sp. S96 TaxID=3055140 RepID=UPI0025AA8227|nr:AraC family transcriptional regulator [Rhizobium sp. S96]MDM9621984.1 AraC family transcriptional regulator [Rhizobium sp. S96]